MQYIFQNIVVFLIKCKKQTSFTFLIIAFESFIDLAIHLQQVLLRWYLTQKKVVKILKFRIFCVYYTLIPSLFMFFNLVSKEMCFLGVYRARYTCNFNYFRLKLPVFRGSWAHLLVYLMPYISPISNIAIQLLLPVPKWAHCLLTLHGSHFMTQNVLLCCAKC